jgi:hypothetical protein
VRGTLRETLGRRMNTLGRIAVGAVGGGIGTVTAMNIITDPDADRGQLIAPGAIGAGAGSVVGIASSVLAKRGTAPLKSALVGTAIGAALPAALIGGAQLVPKNDGGWAQLGMVVLGVVTGAGVAGGGVALTAAALLRR